MHISCRQDCTCTVHALIKKKIKFSSYIRKIRVEQLQYMRKCANISPYVRRPLVIYDFATAPFWFSLYMRKIRVSFLSVCCIISNNITEWCTLLKMVITDLIPSLESRMSLTKLARNTYGIPGFPGIYLSWSETKNFNAEVFSWPGAVNPP